MYARLQKGFAVVALALGLQGCVMLPRRVPSQQLAQPPEILYNPSAVPLPPENPTPLDLARYTLGLRRVDFIERRCGYFLRWDAEGTFDSAYLAFAKLDGDDRVRVTRRDDGTLRLDGIVSQASPEYRERCDRLCRQMDVNSDGILTTPEIDDVKRSLYARLEDGLKE